MTRLLSSGFENGLAYGWPLGFDTYTNPSALSTSSTARHGTSGMLVTGSGTASFVTKTVADQVVTGSLYIRLSSLPSGAAAFVRAPGSLQAFQITVQTNGKLQAQIGLTGGANSITTLSTATWYLIDYRFDASSTTYTLDYRISDTNGTVLETATQVTLASQTAQAHTSLRIGQTGTNALTVTIDDAEADNTSGAYPIGAHTSSDSASGGITSFGPSWLDYPSTIQPSGEILLGHLYQYPVNQATQTPTPAQIAAVEDLISRTIYSAHTVYNDVTPVPPNLASERGLINGTLAGHQITPIIENIGFHSNTVGWPAGGLADFASGAMDGVLQSWADLYNTLPNTPFGVLLWKEQNADNSIYGPQGGTHGGVNELPATFIAAWRYVHDYWKSRCPNVRMIFGQGTSGGESPSARGVYYPGDAYVDWVGCSGFYQLPTYQDLYPLFLNWTQAFGPGVGSVTNTRPWMVTGIGTARTDPNRISHIAAIATLFSQLPCKPKHVHMWHDIPGGNFEVCDVPTGALFATRRLVQTSPFLAVPVDYIPDRHSTQRLVSVGARRV